MQDYELDTSDPADITGLEEDKNENGLEYGANDEKR